MFVVLLITVLILFDIICLNRLNVVRLIVMLVYSKRTWGQFVIVSHKGTRYFTIYFRDTFKEWWMSTL